jgi:protein SCO1/2
VERRRFLVSAAGVLVGTASLLLGAAPRAIARLGPAYFPNVTLTTQHGEKVRFYDDLLLGKIVTINFMYTQCGDICPAMTLNLSKVQRLLGDRVGRDIFMYSISLQPEQDTPQLLKDYAEAFGAGPGWLFLRADSDADTELLRRKLGFYDLDPEVDAKLESHTGILRFGNERINRWAACPALGDPEAITKQIGWMDDRKAKP